MFSTNFFYGEILMSFFDLSKEIWKNIRSEPKVCQAQFTVYLNNNDSLR